MLEANDVFAVYEGERGEVREVQHEVIVLLLGSMCVGYRLC